MVLGIIAVQSISLADTYFIGKLGATELTALSFSFPVALTLGAFSLGLSAGAGSVVSRAFGADEEATGRRLARDAVLLSAGLVLVVAALAMLGARPLFAAMGAQDEALDIVVTYMRILFLSVPLLVMLMVINAVLRAAGDSRWPAALMVGSGVLNVGLTALLVFGAGPIPGLEVAGAAWATVIARGVAFAASVFVVWQLKDLLLIARPTRTELADSARRIARVALPTSAGGAINPIGVAAITSLLAAIGQDAVAGFGVANRIEAFASIPMFALSAAMSSFAGQNWGAERVWRVRQALRQTYLASLAWSVCVAVGLWFFGESAAELFTDDEAVRAQATSYLRIVPISLAGYGVIVITANAFSAVDHSRRGLVAHAIRSFALIVPGAWIAARIADAPAVFTVIAIANAVAGLGVALYALRWFAKAEEHCEGEPRDVSWREEAACQGC